MAVFSDLDVKNHVWQRSWDRDHVGVSDNKGRLIATDTTGDGKIVRAISPNING